MPVVKSLWASPTIAHTVRLGPYLTSAANQEDPRDSHIRSHAHNNICTQTPHRVYRKCPLLLVQSP